MSLWRVAVLVEKELFHGPRSFLLVWALVAPVLISLVISLVFGNLIQEKPRLGIVDEGDSELVGLARGTPSISVRVYDSDLAVRQAVTQGHVDVGIVLPAEFDASVRQGKETRVTGYISDTSLARSGTVLGVTLFNLIREMIGQDAPVAIEKVILGDRTSVPWDQRLLPLVVLMAVFLGGMFLPATSVISEKERRTITALFVTPVTPGEFFLAKGIVGIGLSVLSGVLILVLNRAFGAEPLLLVMVLALGAGMAAALGLLLGVVLKDVTTLFAVWKSGGILLFGPALVFMFPQIPEWVARLFPTYYLLQPVMEISQRGGGWASISTNVLVLVVLDVLLGIAVSLAVRRSSRRGTVG